MDINEFYKKLIEWLDHINKSGNTPNIILEQQFFDYDAITQMYSLNKENASCFERIKYIFVADNPGTQEQEKRKYLFYSDDKNWLKDNRSNAGVKFHSFVKRFKLNEKEDYIIFNKCLLFTEKTSKLTAVNIDSTKHLVVDFLKALLDFREDIKVVFMGLDHRFDKRIYKQLLDYQKQMLLIPHPCSSLYKHNKKTVISNDVNDINTFILKWDYKELLIRIIEKWFGDDGDASNVGVR